jgi:hypothetical protein
MSKKVYQDKFYIKPGKKQIVYGHEGHYYDVTNDVIKAMFHYMLLNFVELNFNKDEKDPIKIFEIEDGDGFTLAIYPTPEENKKEKKDGE